MGLEAALLIALLVWTFLQSRWISRLAREIETLKDEVRALRMGAGLPDSAASASTNTAPVQKVSEPPLPQPANETLPELLLTNVVIEDEIEPPPLAPVLVKTEEQPELALTQVVAPQAAPAAPPPSRIKQDRALERWLSENGLAWLGGGAFALGGVFLVGYAAQQGFFTPIMRLFAAVIVGLGLIGAGEWVRRDARRRPAGHALVAALLAGAGASTLYAAAWAAYGLYGYIDWPVAVLALAVCAAILLTLSFLHGEALGILAIAAALLTPPLTTMPIWPPPALFIYLAAVCVAGFGVVGLQRWSWLAATITLGAYVWFALSLGDGAMYRALAMLELTALGGWALGFRAPLATKPGQAAAWGNVQAWLPSLTLGASALLMVLCWNAAAIHPSLRAAGPALVGAFLAGLTALAVRSQVARPSALAAAIGALALGVFAYARNLTSLIGMHDLYLWALFSAGAAVLSALAGVPRGKERALISSVGASSALFILFLATITRPVWSAPEVWGALGVGGVLLGLAAEYMARQSRDKTKDLGVDVWGAAAAAAILFALESLVPQAFKSIGDAFAATAFASVALLRGWRIAGPAAVAAAALALTHAISPAFAGQAWTGALSIWTATAILAVTALGLYGAAWLLRSRDRRAQAAEALSAAAILTLLLMAFLLLHSLASGPVRMDFFTEAALRALMLIAAGFVTMAPRNRPVGIIARWRGHVLMLVGLAFGLIASGLLFNPWWGAEPARATGAPLFNTQALAFAAPAALAALAANRLYRDARSFGRLYAAIAALFAFQWIALELRRAFHGSDLATGAIGLLEGNAYGLTALGAACALTYWTKRRAQSLGGRPFSQGFSQDLVRLSGTTAFAGLLIGAWFMLFSRNAWWGGQDSAQTDALTTALASLAQAPAAALAFFLGLALPKRAANASFVAASVAILFALAFGFCILRWAHHQGAMDDWLALVGLEGLFYALWPMALVGGGAALTPRLIHRASARELALDFNAIWAVAVWPALVFAGFALWAMFNPWRGIWPAAPNSLLSAFVGLLCYLAAAALSLSLARLRIVSHDPLLPNAARIAAIIHLFAAAMLVVRYGFHPSDMATFAHAPSLETWTYSAVWAVFGAMVLGAGALRGDPILRWTGLSLLLGVTAKVFLVDMAQLAGVVRAASFLGLGAVLVAVAMATRRIGQSPARE